jgi:hypothetical protein
MAIKTTRFAAQRTGPSGSPAMSSSTRCSRHPNQRMFAGRASHSSRVLAPHGTPIR